MEPSPPAAPGPNPGHLLTPHPDGCATHLGSLDPSALRTRCPPPPSPQMLPPGRELQSPPTSGPASGICVTHLCPQAPRPLRDVTGVRERVSLPSHQIVLTAPGKSLFHRLQYSPSAHADSKRHARAVKALELRCCAQAADRLGQEVLSPSLYSKTLLQWGLHHAGKSAHKLQGSLPAETFRV